MKKKIIFVTKALWIGGIETALVNLLNNFNYKKYDVTLLVLKAELDMLKQIHPKCRVLIADRDETVSFQEKYRYSRLYHLTEESENPSRLHKMMMWTVPVIRWTENRFYIRYIRKMMRGERFDTAVIYSDVAGETAVRAIRADKYLMFYHHGAMRHVYHDRIAYKKCEKIIAVSQHQAMALRSYIPKYAYKIVAVNNLADIKGIREKSKKTIQQNFEGKKFNIVTCGRVSKEKGMDLAIDACYKLILRGYKNIRWWIIGDGPVYNEIKDQIQRLNLENYVYLVGMKENPYPYIEKADLYVQPSRFEGYPMSILEALILKKIVVATANKGAEEMLKKLNCGILSKIDSQDLSEKIEELIENEQYYDKKRHEISEIDFEHSNMENLKQIEGFL